MRQTIEQTAVYGILVLMVGLLFLFGLTTAVNGVHSIVGTNEAQQQKNDLQILGKDMRGTKPPWSRQLSHDLEGKSSGVAQFVDQSSLHFGDWMQAGSKQFLQVLSRFVPQ